MFYYVIENLSDQKNYETNSKELLKIIGEPDLKALGQARRLEKKSLSVSISKIIKELFESDFHNFRILKKTSGKPFLKNLKTEEIYEISYSHSKNHLIFVFSGKLSIGVDVEEKSRFENHKAFKKWLHPDEYEIYEKGKLSLEALTEIWTKKEALTKLTEKGYSINFREILLHLKSEVHFEGRDIVFKSIFFDDKFISMAFFKDQVDFSNVIFTQLN